MLTRKNFAIAALAGLASLAASPQAEARDYIRIVGSSTVFPFAAAAAEEFAHTTSFKGPVIESTGTGGGFKLFCAGVGVQSPDIVNASRRIKDSEFETCRSNGVGEITEVKIGFDGIVIANSTKADPFNLTLQDIFLALANHPPPKAKADVPAAYIANWETTTGWPDDHWSEWTNPYETWDEIDPALPDTKIDVYGPPPTSGTRDAFVELAMEGGCRTFPEIEALKEKDQAAYKAICHSVREDGAFIEAGENDNLIVQKLKANPSALGIFGFSFLDQNLDTVQGSAIEGVWPAFDSIAVGSYPIARSLYFYVKKAHVGVIPGIREYIDTFTSESLSGEEGFLADLGLIPLPEEERIRVREAAMALKPLKL